MVVPWYFLDTDLALVRLLCVTERETISNVLNLLVSGSLYLSTSVHRISSIILNSFSTLFILYMLSHMLTCVFVRMYREPGQVFFDLYIAYHYYIYATVSTIGYGDITLKSFSDDDNSIGQLLVMIMVIVFGLNYYALVQSKIRQIYSELVALESYRNSEIEGMDDWMIQRNVSSGMPVPFKFEKKVKELFTYSLSHDIQMLINLHGFIDMISSSQKRDILESVAAWYVKKFRYFEGISPENAVRMVVQLKTAHFLNGDKIIGKAHQSSGIYFVLQGRVVVMDISRSLQVFRLGEGQFFGDFCHLSVESQFDYVAQGDCYCLFLDQQAVSEILEESSIDLAYLLLNSNERVNQWATVVGSFMHYHPSPSNIASDDTKKQKPEPEEVDSKPLADFLNFIPSSEREKVLLGSARKRLISSKEQTSKFLMRGLVSRWCRADAAKEGTPRRWTSPKCSAK